MKEIDVGPFLQAMENELRSCDGSRARQILGSLERWAKDAALNDKSRENAQRLAGKARFRLALASCTESGPTPERGDLVGRLRDSRPPQASAESEPPRPRAALRTS